MPSLAELIQQLYTDATNPASPFFLPTVILEQTLPAEPLAIADLDWGSLSGISPDLPDALCAAISSGTICTPQTSATLTLTQPQIVGLSNVVPSPPTVNGTEVWSPGIFVDISITVSYTHLTLPTILRV